MHYRKKTPKDEAKEKEKLTKAQNFHVAMTKFLNLKKTGCLDLNYLKDIGNLLLINPEFTTLWHYRKEILTAYKTSIETPLDNTSLYSASEKISEESKEETKQKSKKEFHQLCLNELSFVENCLKSSPKSYPSWHHRAWLIQFMYDPDLQKELQLCNQCLSLDERNFHCWDYRRFIVKFGQIPTMDEFRFTTRKINDNFSNFSSWHYRSCLYRQLLKENYDRDAIQSMIDQDFEIVKNAIFTDPNDQSPWLYLRWLLEFETFMNGWITVESKIVRYLLAYRNSENFSNFIVEFDKSYPKPYENCFSLKINGQNVLLNSRKPIFDGSICMASIVSADIHLNQNKQEFQITFGGETFYHTFDSQDLDRNRNYSFIYTANQEQSAKDYISKRIEDLKVLLEIEVNSKWPNYMLPRLLGSLDSTQHDNIDALIQMDPLRINYYNDLRSKSILRRKLPFHTEFTDLDLNLSGISLHSLHFMNHFIFIQYLDLSQNHLIRLGQSLSPLVNLRCLLLDNNQIYLCDNKLCLENLKILSLANNRIDVSPELIENFLAKISPKLEHLDLTGNPLKESVEAIQTIRIYLNSEDQLEFKSIVNLELKQIRTNNKVYWNKIK